MIPPLPLTLVLAALITLCAGAALAALAGRRDRFALAVGTVTTAAACVVGGTGSVLTLLDGRSRELSAVWPLAVGALRVGVDPLTAFFLLCIFLVSGLGAVYGAGYLAPLAGRRRLAAPVALFALLVASMAGVALARDGVLFLLAWEAMSLTSFFLVLHDGERAETRRAAVTYLIASHIGALPLFALFLLLAGHAGGFGFAALAHAGPPAAGLAALCFVLALVGFGAKAGFWPLHVWLPEAHPAAPSHVSAVMSGVMIKLGIYGLLRVLPYLGPPPTWWGVTVLGIGCVSAVAGVLHALAQHDLKRLLAYHSVENIGIIAMGLGLGLLGQAAGQPTMAFLGYAGAVLHVLNHGLFKGLLFEGAGAVLHATGSRDFDQLGGLGKRMPTTAATFLVGAAAISGLPPLNGFASELLVYSAAFLGAFSLHGASGLALAAIPTLALVGGLASACFVKAHGVVFLGEPRSEAAAHAHEPGWAMRAPLLVGAALCVAIGVWPAGALALVARVGGELTGVSAPVPAVTALLAGATRVALLLLAILGTLVLVRRALLRRRDVRAGATWGCGYEAPTARMQYTAASFADPVLHPFTAFLHRSARHDGPDGPFPKHAAVSEHLGDHADRVYAPLVRGLVAALARVRRLEDGRTQRYLALILATLVALLVWQLGIS